MAKVNPAFIEKLAALGDFNALECLNCGVCTAVCPMEIDVLPRKLFRHVLLGLEDKVFEQTPAIYQCLLCKMCEENCTGNVRIAENVRLLRTYIGRELYRL